MRQNLALLLNFFCPGLGTLILGKVRVGLAQLVVLLLSLLAIAYSFHIAYFIMLLAADWAWGLFVAGYSLRTGGVSKERRI
jgi:hypothetical protein